MKYFGQKEDLSLANEKTGVLIANLGTPEAPKCPKLRRYLTQFLTDPRVIELPGLLRQFLVRGIIINIRSHKSAAAYRQVWTDEGSPLLVYSRQLTEQVQSQLDNQAYGHYIVKTVMRYGEPSIQNGLKELHSAGCRNIIILPLYPQYSGTTTGSIFDAIGQSLSKHRWVPNIRFINSYHQHPHYIDALCQSIEQHWQQHSRGQMLVFSFHGIPVRYVNNGDPYQMHCEETVALVTQKLGLSDDQWMLTYQSRVGREPWLEPYCDQTMKSLPGKGVKSVDVICPGFSVDCLETLEEIEEENKTYFLQAGGQSYQYIQCLNSSPAHSQMVCDLIQN
ncbi:MAG: ferrochelatase [Arenicella sp.]